MSLIEMFFLGGLYAVMTIINVDSLLSQKKKINLIRENMACRSRIKNIK